MYRGILLHHLHISVSVSVTKPQAFQPLIIKIRLRVWHLQIIWPASSKLRSITTLSVQKARVKAASSPSATAGRKCFHVLPAKLRTKKSPHVFLLDSRQTDVPLMPRNWKKSSLIFSRPVSRKLFSIKTPTAPNWNRQSFLPKIRIRFAHS